MLDTMLSADSLNKLSIKLCSEQTNLREVFKCDKVYGFTTIVLDLYSLDNSLAGEAENVVVTSTARIHAASTNSSRPS